MNILKKSASELYKITQPSKKPDARSHRAYEAKISLNQPKVKNKI